MLTGLAYSEDASNYDIGFVNTGGADKKEKGSDGVTVFAHALPLDFSGIGIGPLLNDYYLPFGLLHGLYPAFGFSLQDKSLEKFVTWTVPYGDNGIFGNLAGMGDDDASIAEFFATLGIDIVDWHMVMENSLIPGHHDAAAPVPDHPAVVRPGHRKVCLQGHREFARKSELQASDCFDGGGLAGFGSNFGRSRISTIANGNNANPNFSRNNPGAAGGAGGGAGGNGSSGGSGEHPGTSAGGSDGQNGSGGGLPDTGTGGGEGGTGDSEVYPVPEPSMPALLLLGLACVYYMRNRISWR